MRTWVAALCAISVAYGAQKWVEWAYDDHGDGEQSMVFAVVLLSFLSPALAPFVQAKLFLFDDVLPGFVESYVVASVAPWLLTPSGSFGDYDAGAPTNYSDPMSWSMLPGRGDTSEVVARGLRTCAEAGLCGAADVFYLHPTTWYTSASWNAPARHPVTSYLSDDAIGPQQANAFNVVGRVFAPRYRQMAAAAFLQEGGFDHPNAQQALGVAYADVSAAFAHFLAHFWDGQRPLILAGHSQGSLLAEKLLLEYFHGKPLQRKLVAAYLPGWTIFKSTFASGSKKNGKNDVPTPDAVSVCANATSLGCVLSWRTYGTGGDPTAFLHVESESEGGGRGSSATAAAAERVCTNPLSWLDGGGYVGSAANLGGLDLMHPWTMLRYLAGVSRPSKRVVLPGLTPNASDAECRDGHLFVTPPARLGSGWLVWPAWRFASFPGRNLHPFDLNLFYANVRDNVEQRVRAFLQSNQPQTVND